MLDTQTDLQFPLPVDAFKVLVHSRHSDLEQLGYERLRQPQVLVLKPALDAGAAILCLVEDDFGIGQRFFAHEGNLRLEERKLKSEIGNGSRDFTFPISIFTLFIMSPSPLVVVP